MFKQKSYHLAVEVDRALQLNLSNGQFQLLVSYIDNHEDGHKISRDLMGGKPQATMMILNTLKEK